MYEEQESPDTRQGSERRGSKEKKIEDKIKVLRYQEARDFRVFPRNVKCCLVLSLKL